MLSELGPFWPWLSCSLVIHVSSPRPVHIQTVHLKDYVHCSHFVVVYLYMHAHIYIHIYTVHAVLCMLCFYVNCSQSVVLIVVLHTLDLLLFYSQAVHVLFCLRCLCTFSPCFAVLVLYVLFMLCCGFETHCSCFVMLDVVLYKITTMTIEHRQCTKPVYFTFCDSAIKAPEKCHGKFIVKFYKFHYEFHMTFYTDTKTLVSYGFSEFIGDYFNIWSDVLTLKSHNHETCV